MRNLRDLILSPTQLFESLKRKPSWLTPFVIVGLLGILVAVLLQPAQANISLTRLGETLPPDQIEQAMGRARTFTLITTSLIPLVTLIRWGIIAGIITITTGMFTDKLRFKQSFSIISYSSVILLLGSIVNTAALYIRGLDAISSPRDLWLIGLNFWGQETLGVPFSLFLSEITVFSVWYLTLVALGLTVVADISKIKAAFVSVFVWLLGVGFKIGMALIGSQLVPSG